MKILGTSAKAGFSLSRRHVSKPSMLGISASISTTSGVMFWLMVTAWVPSRATSTVMPASSRASLIMRMESIASSTTMTTVLW